MEPDKNAALPQIRPAVPSRSHLGGRHVGNRQPAGFFSRIRLGHVRHGRGRARAGEPRPRQIRRKTVRGKLCPVPQERARPRQGTDELHAVVLPAPALHEQQRVGGYAHRLTAIGRHAARQGESRREEIPGGQVTAEGRGKGRNDKRNNERAGLKTADRHDQRGPARQTAGEDPGAIIAAISLNTAAREIAPEMIEAGAKAVEAELWDCCPSPSTAANVAESVLRAALSLSLRKHADKIT
jgi:hypothetical protein